MNPRTLWERHPVTAMIALSVAPEGCFSKAMMRSVFVLSRPTAGCSAPLVALPFLNCPPDPTDRCLAVRELSYSLYSR